MRRFCFLSFALLFSAPAQAWGPTGHRITGILAEQNLSGVARAQVRLLLGTESLAEAATWPDDMRSDPDPFWQRSASPWHYVTLHGPHGYTPSDAPGEGDAMTALAHYSAVLRDPKASHDDKASALRFVVHIIGDLHQPLHVGKPGDRGGNDVKVAWFSKPSNLHSIWDSEMIDGARLSYSEYAGWLSARMTPADVIGWSTVDPAHWIEEGAKLRDTAYPATSETNLSWSYAYRHRPEVEKRLSQAGVRIAAYLNGLFARS